MPQISIIVPVYNAEKYLVRCIDSILAQTFTDFELILVNDGSVDKSSKIIEEYTKKDCRIVGIHQRNSGVSAARNAGLSIAKGKYIGFVDSDDTIEPTMYQKLFDAIKRNNAEVAICNYNNITHEREKMIASLEQTKEYCIMDNEELLERVFEKGQRWLMRNVWTKLIKAELAKKVIFDNTVCYGEDTFYSYQVLLSAKKTVSLAEPLYNYYIYQGSASHGGVTGEERLMSVEVHNQLAQDLKKQGYIDLSHKTYAHYVDFLLREINENRDDEIYNQLLKKTFKHQWFRMLLCTEIRFKLKICYLLYMLKV